MQTQRIIFLDGLRGVAALLVVFGHVLEEFIRLHPTSWIDSTLEVSGFGRIGVVAFFCISGFVIPFSFSEPHPVRNFVISRFFRLYPTYWISLGLAAVFAGGLSTRMLLANATMAPVLFGEPNAISVYWTLFIELLFYFVCLIMFTLGVLSNTKALAFTAAVFWVIAICSAVLTWTDGPIQPPAGIPGYLGIMFLGAVWRKAWLDEDIIARRLMPWLVLSFAFTTAAVGLLGHNSSNYPDRPIADFIGVYLGVLLFFVAFRWQSFLRSRRTAWLGNISYSLYLLHPLVVMICSWAAEISNSRVLAAFALAFSVILSLFIGQIAYNLIERPSIRIGKLIAHAIPGKISAPT